MQGRVTDRTQRFTHQKPLHRCMRWATVSDKYLRRRPSKGKHHGRSYSQAQAAGGRSNAGTGGVSCSSLAGTRPESAAAALSLNRHRHNHHHNHNFTKSEGRNDGGEHLCCVVSPMCVCVCAWGGGGGGVLTLFLCWRVGRVCALEAPPAASCSAFLSWAFSGLPPRLLPTLEGAPSLRGRPRGRFSPGGRTGRGTADLALTLISALSGRPRGLGRRPGHGLSRRLDCSRYWVVSLGVLSGAWACLDPVMHGALAKSIIRRQELMKRTNSPELCCVSAQLAIV